MRILIIEDDRRLARLIQRVLEDEHYLVSISHDGSSGLEMALAGTYDVAIVDWMLPKQDGPAICRAVRAARRPVALLMLTARGQIEDRVCGLDSGADDYLVKPFAFEELLARVRALGRRALPESGANYELRCGDLVMDLRSHTVRSGNQTLDLTATEWNLLEFLLRHPGQALNRQQILDYVWSFEREVQPNMVDVYISYLRRKLERPGRSNPITTVRGVGYRLEAGGVS
ncbi:MAG: response regulator transcription factor [Chloroflexaceae bacterium]|nr:response regulator transcription factor [Chloroflexaceae bacterium]